MLKSVFWKIFENTGYVDAYMLYNVLKCLDDNGLQVLKPDVEANNIEVR